MSKGMKWGLGLVVVLAAAGAAAAKARSGEKATEVRIESVEKRDLVASVTASGQVQPVTKVDVAADISGRIVRLAVKEGEIVKRGQFLLEIDPAQYQAAVQRSEAAVASARASEAQAKANLQQATRTYERSLEIQKTNAALISVESLEQLKTAVEVNTALLESASQNAAQSAASLREARSNLSRTTIMAPMAGKITRLAVEQGETAVPGTFNRDAAILLTISDLSAFETKVKVDETDVARISLGDSALIQIDAFPDTTFTGRVVEISNSAVRAAGATTTSSEQAIDYEVTIQLMNPPNETRPDFSATAKIVTDQRTAVLTIPIIALTVRENEAIAADTAGIPGQTKQREVGKKDVEGVFIVGADNKVTFRPVKVGIAGDKYFEVIDGLKDAEKIVGGTYQAIRELKDGALVKEPKVDKKPAAGAKT
ncbi:MAG: efflux RND transporter periplasmic adaptor subunit [Gemmatimonadetes bacterium]|nr:efflux RND transporter periplasmic adaptor subunit [Gemmatimonadota bacterium]MCC6773726.1 efflux RND transporter periplasmic adaptor subunit [Gemmatimonadaceae bacterium]